MTSFGTTKRILESFGTTKRIREPGFMPTFKVQGANLSYD